MLILNGTFRNEEAELIKLNEQKFSCDIKINAVSATVLLTIIT